MPAGPVPVAATLTAVAAESPSAPPNWKHVWNRPPARPWSRSATPSVAAMVSGPYASAKAVPTSSIVGNIARYTVSCATGRNSAYPVAAATRPPSATRTVPQRLTRRGVSVGASTASMPSASIARLVSMTDQPRSSCK